MKSIKSIDSQNRSVLVNIFGAFLVKGGSLMISVLLLPLYLDFFQEQKILGVWYTILSVLNWITLFDLGLGHGLRNQLPSALVAKNKRLAKEYISTTYILMSFVAGVVTVFGIAVIPHLNLYAIFNIDPSLISHSDMTKSINIVFVGIMAQIVVKIITSVLYAMQKSAIVNALSLLTNLIILAALYVIPSRDTANNLIAMSWVNVLAATLPYIICTVIIFASGELKGAGPSLKAFNKEYIKSIFNIGMSLMWLQIVFMVVSSVNEFLISNLTAPEYVVEYQAYYKVFKTAAMIVSLALTPIWSAVTKAQIEKRYLWIKKIYYIFLGISVLCFVGELCLIPILQWGMNLWLGEGVVEVNILYALIFTFSSTIFVLHNVNISIGNGLSYFKVQMIWMTVAAVLFIPLAVLFVKWFASWIGVVLASVIAMMPYEMLAPIFTIRRLNKMADLTPTK